MFCHSRGSAMPRIDDTLLVPSWMSMVDEEELLIQLQKIFTGELCNMWSDIIIKEHDISQFWMFLCNCISHMELLTVELSSDCILVFLSESCLHIPPDTNNELSFDAGWAAWSCAVALLSVQVLLHNKFKYRYYFSLVITTLFSQSKLCFLVVPCRGRCSKVEQFVGPTHSICWLNQFLPNYAKWLMPNFSAWIQAHKCSLPMCTGWPLLSWS